MTSEIVSVRRRDGVVAVARAEVVRHSTFRRVSTASVSIGFGVFLALVFLPIPGLHFFSTWMFPLMGLVIAAYLGTKRGDVVSLETRCPGCGEDVALPGGAIEANMWRACPRCGVPLEILA
jgi:ribosomal protein S27AE